MPIRTALSHALVAVTVATTWVLFKNSLEIFITRNQMTRGVLVVAEFVSEHAGIGVHHGKLVTMLMITAVTLLAFVWGYTFHQARFGR